MIRLLRLRSRGFEVPTMTLNGSVVGWMLFLIYLPNVSVFTVKYTKIEKIEIIRTLLTQQMHTMHGNGFSLNT